MARHKPRLARDYRRKEATREPYDVVLIVCEGEKTEPNYLKGLQKAYQLSNANITIVPGDGNDPVSIVKCALDTYQKADGIFDRVFCVFDRDSHVNYQQALDRISTSPLGRKGKLEAITSVPCFELWILLHFVYTTAPFAGSGGRSACEKVIEAVREYLPEYEKAMTDVFQKLQPNVDIAVTHAERLVEHNRDTDSENPATKVHELVKYLRGLRDVNRNAAK